MEGRSRTGRRQAVAETSPTAPARLSVRDRLRRPGSKEKLRFLAAGAFNTVFGYVVFAALVLLLPALHYTLALVVAYVIAVLVAFAVYRSFVFRVAATGGLRRDLPRFFGVNLVALGLNLILLPLLVAVVGIPVLLAQWLVVVVTAVASYLGHKHFSFRRAAAPADDAVPADR